MNGVTWTLRQAFASRRPEDVRTRQRARLTEMLAFVRSRSPYYRELYRDVPERVEDPSLLPVTDKKKLMARFDDWVTDREVTLEGVRAFVGDLNRIGELFLGKYTVATTSGTNGSPGIFLLDASTLKATNALALRMMSAWLGPRDVLRIATRGLRVTMVCATGGHYAEAVAAARLRKRSRRHAKAVQVLSAHMPLPDMVAELNRFRPAMLAPYASVGVLLAGEKQEGRLRIDPALVVLSAEGLPQGRYDRISRTFGVTARHSYAATECTFISYSCDHHWLHVNADWVLLEPVDADYRPVRPGELSHTALVSNLANRVQPILRYDIGDRVLRRPDPCPCGNPLPAVRVEGRTADMLTFAGDRGERIGIPALMFEVVDTPGVELVQVVQVSPTALRVRLDVAPGTQADAVWTAVHREITRSLAERKLHHVTVERADERPEQSSGGKFRAIIPLAETGSPGPPASEGESR